jgi:hypothetical protein
VSMRGLRRKARTFLVTKQGVPADCHVVPIYDRWIVGLANPVLENSGRHISRLSKVDKVIITITVLI